MEISHISANILRLRRQLRWSRLKTAARAASTETAREYGLEITPDRIKAWETGDAIPSMIDLLALAEAMKVPVEVFFYAPDPKGRPV